MIIRVTHWLCGVTPYNDQGNTFVVRHDLLWRWVQHICCAVWLITIIRATHVLCGMTKYDDEVKTFVARRAVLHDYIKTLLHDDSVWCWMCMLCENSGRCACCVMTQYDVCRVVTLMSNIWWACHVTHTNEPWHTYEWVMSHIWMSHDSRIIRCIDMWHMTALDVWRNLFVCVMWLIHMSDMTHSHVWHDSFICVTWLIYMFDMTHS